MNLSASLQLACVEAGILAPQEEPPEALLSDSQTLRVGDCELEGSNHSADGSSGSLRNSAESATASLSGENGALDFKCTLCGGVLTGNVRYHCLQCQSVDLCAECHEKLSKPEFAQMQTIPQEPPAREFYYYPAFGRSLWFAHEHEHYVREFRHCQPLPPKRGGAAFRVATTYQTLENALRYWGDERFLGVRSDFGPTTAENAESQFQWLSYRQTLQRVIHCGSGLRTRFEPRTFVAICSINRPEWLLADLACARQDYPSVPINVNQDLEGLHHILSSTETQCVVCSADLIATFVEAIRTTPPDKPIKVRLIVSMDDKLPSGALESTNALGIELLRFSELEAIGSESIAPAAVANPSDLYTLTYTSGSTGVPKGVMFTNQTFLNRICVGYGMPFPLVTVSFCSFAHFMVRVP